MGKHYDDPLEFLLDGEAESLYDGKCTDLTPSRALRAVWSTWGDRVRDALDTYWKLRPQDVSVPLDDVYDEDKILVDFDVYATVVGMGVGVEDGDWDHFFDGSQSVRRCAKFLGNELGKYASDVETALHNDAYDQCKDVLEYTVDVGNVGTVYSGTDEDEAIRVFNEYVGQSKSGTGRAAGEDVTLSREGEPIDEYSPPRRRGMKIDPNLDGYGGDTDNELFSVVVKGTETVAKNVANSFGLRVVGVHAVIAQESATLYVRGRFADISRWFADSGNRAPFPPGSLLLYHHVTGGDVPAGKATARRGMKIKPQLDGLSAVQDWPKTIIVNFPEGSIEARDHTTHNGTIGTWWVGVKSINGTLLNYTFIAVNEANTMQEAMIVAAKRWGVSEEQLRALAERSQRLTARRGMKIKPTLEGLFRRRY